MNTARYGERREKLRRLLRENDLEALLVTLDANRFYLSGFELIDHQVNESAGCLVITRSGRDWLCTDPRYAEAAKRLWEPESIFIYGAGAPTAVNALLKDNVKGTVGFEESAMTVRFFNAVGEGVSMKPADGLVESLRMIKEPEEVERMRAAVALNHKLMEWIPGTFSRDDTERDIAWSVERFFRENGAQSLSFPSITAIGPNAALPHAVPGATRLTENTCVLVDVGCRLDDYCSDQTRTFWVGDKPSGVFMDTLSLVRTAQEQAIAAIRPGKTAAGIYAVARTYLDNKGVGDKFTHGLGHGIGLQTHENPSLNPRSTTVLQPGMIITVEPGLYYPEWGGVRWEYMVLVTEDGSTIL